MQSDTTVVSIAAAIIIAIYGKKNYSDSLEKLYSLLCTTVILRQ